MPLLKIGTNTFWLKLLTSINFENDWIVDIGSGDAIEKLLRPFVLGLIIP